MIGFPDAWQRKFAAYLTKIGVNSLKKSKSTAIKRDAETGKARTTWNSLHPKRMLKNLTCLNSCVNKKNLTSHKRKNNIESQKRNIPRKKDSKKKRRHLREMSRNTKIKVSKSLRKI